DTDGDEVNDVISCTIDNNQINIDAKTISPFKYWLYSQRYDRKNASIKRSIERSAANSISGIENETTA
ncbi:unnamed protein product, partial [Adineta steineri]